MNITYTGGINFKSNNTGNIIQSFGKALSSSISFDGIGGGWTLQDNFATSTDISLITGSLNTNNVTINAASFTITGNNTRSLTLGASILNLTFTSTWGWNLSGSNLTLNTGTSTINLTGVSSYFVTDNRTYSDVNFTGTNISALYPGNSTFHNVSFSGDASISGDGTYNNLSMGTGKTATISGIETIIGSFTENGTCSIPSVLNGGTISKTTGTVTINYVRLQNSTASGGATFTANNTTDFGNNVGWIINHPATQNLHWVNNGGNWTDPSHWSLTVGGISSGCIPSPYDNAFFDAGSFNSVGQTVTMDQPGYAKSMSWTGATNTPTFAGSSALSLYGSLTLNPSMNITYTGNLYFKSTSTGNTIQSLGKALSSSIFFDGAGGGWTLQDNFTTSSNIDLTTGSLNTNNTTLTAFIFTSTGGGIRTLTLGSSTLNLSFTSTWAWNASGANFTFNAGTSTINLTGTYNYFASDTRNYYDINFSGTSGAGLYPGGSTFHNVSFASNATFSGDGIYNNLSLGTSKTTTISGIETITGILIANGTCSVPAIIDGGTISKTTGSVTINYIRLKNSNGAGGALFTANNTTDLGNNTGWIINNPATQNLHWVGNGGNWTDPNHWSLTMGGASSGCIPSPYDNVYFDAQSFNSGGQTITIDQLAYVKSMNWTGVLNSPTLAGSSPLNINGSFVLNALMNITYTGMITFGSTVTGNTIQTFGRPLLSSILFDGPGGGWTMVDNFTTASDIVLTRGSLNINNVTVNASTFASTGSGLRSLTLGSSILNFSYQGVWGWNASGTNFTLNAGTSTINLTGANSYFISDNKTYYDVKFTGALHGYLYTTNTVFHTVTFLSDASISGDGFYNNLVFSPNNSSNINGNQSISGSLINN